MRWSACGLGLALVAATLLPRPGSAQVVRGQVVSARDSSVMPAVIVQLLDSTGAVVGRTLSDDEGRFRLVASAPGRHRLRTLRVGFRPTLSEPLLLAAGADATPRLALSPVPLELDAVNVSARNACRVYADAGTAADLWDQARTAFTAARLSSAERRVAVTMTTYHRELHPRTEAVLAQRVDAQSGFTHRPWASLSADSLRTVGYVVRQRDGWTVYYAPDLDVLASDVFLFDHCLRLAGERNGMVGIAFEPARDRSRVAEIAGTAWLDRRSYELRSLEFRYVNVSRAHREAASGGAMEFLRVGNLWAISSWHIRMPVIERREQAGRLLDERVTQLQIAGGDLVLVRRRSDTLWARPAVSLAAILVDSATGAPLRGAQVEVLGTRLHAETDSAGSFSISGVLPGIYTLRVSSPDMAALGAAHDARVVVAGGEHIHRIPVPTTDYTLQRLCPDLQPRHGAVIGRVVSRGEASPANLAVIARWEVYSVRAAGSGVLTMKQPRVAHTTTHADGSFVLCNVPTLTTLSLRTAWDEKGPGAEVNITGEARVLRVELRVDPPAD